MPELNTRERFDQLLNSSKIRYKSNLLEHEVFVDFFYNEHNEPGISHTKSVNSHLQGREHPYVQSFTLSFIVGTTEVELERHKNIYAIRSIQYYSFLDEWKYCGKQDVVRRS